MGDLSFWPDETLNESAEDLGLDLPATSLGPTPLPMALPTSLVPRRPEALVPLATQQTHPSPPPTPLYSQSEEEQSPRDSEAAEADPDDEGMLRR